MTDRERYIKARAEARRFKRKYLKQKEAIERAFKQAEEEFNGVSVDIDKTNHPDKNLAELNRMFFLRQGMSAIYKIFNKNLREVYESKK